MKKERSASHSDGFPAHSKRRYERILRKLSTHRPDLTAAYEHIESRLTRANLPDNILTPTLKFLRYTDESRQILKKISRKGEKLETMEEKDRFWQFAEKAVFNEIALRELSQTFANNSNYDLLTPLQAFQFFQSVKGIKDDNSYNCPSSFLLEKKRSMDLIRAIVLC